MYLSLGINSKYESLVTYLANSIIFLLKSATANVRIMSQYKLPRLRNMTDVTGSKMKESSNLKVKYLKRNTSIFKFLRKITKLNKILITIFH